MHKEIFIWFFVLGKDDDEADTVGCCTLKVGNVECVPPNKLKVSYESLKVHIM